MLHLLAIATPDRYLFKAFYSIKPLSEKTLKNIQRTVFLQKRSSGTYHWEDWFLLWKTFQESHALILLLDKKDSTSEKTWKTQLDEAELILTETFLPAFVESRWYHEDPVFEKFRIALDNLFKTPLQVKVSLIGEEGVGKSTLVKLLSHDNPTIPPPPTVGVEIKTLRLELTRGNITLWDFSGQDKYRDLWLTQISGSDLVLLVVDSTDDTVQPSKRTVQLVRGLLPKTPLYVIANKQDLPQKLPPKTIATALGCSTLGLSAVKLDQRSKLIKFLENALPSRKSTPKSASITVKSDKSRKSV